MRNRGLAQDSDTTIHDRKSEQHAVEPIQETAVSRQNTAGVLFVISAFEEALTKIADLSQNADKNRNDDRRRPRHAAEDQKLVEQHDNEASQEPACRTFPS